MSLLQAEILAANSGIAILLSFSLFISPITILNPAHIIFETIRPIDSGYFSRDYNDSCFYYFLFGTKNCRGLL